MPHHNNNSPTTKRQETTQSITNFLICVSSRRSLNLHCFPILSPKGRNYCVDQCQNSCTIVIQSCYSFIGTLNVILKINISRGNVYIAVLFVFFSYTRVPICRSFTISFILHNLERTSGLWMTTIFEYGFYLSGLFHCLKDHVARVNNLAYI